MSLLVMGYGGYRTSGLLCPKPRAVNGSLVYSAPGVGQPIALYALPAAGNHAVLISDLPVHAASFSPNLCGT